jgi:hypothetical protein
MNTGGKQITLSNGRTLTIDLYTISMKEYRGLFDPSQSAEQDDAVYAKVLGITAEELADMPQPDYRWACRSVLDAAKEPLADPNSQSVSTTP